MGRRTARIGSILLIRHNLPFGLCYWYTPRPALDVASLGAVLEYGRPTGALFLKVDPVEALPLAWIAAIPSPAVQPSTTLYLDLRRSDDDLFVAMHPKMRYNIRLAERHGVVVRAVLPPVNGGSFSAFWRLLEDTSRRDGFRLHPAEYYRILFEIQSPEFSNTLFVAEAGGEPVAAAIVNCYRPSGTAVYLHGGSSREHRALMAPHLLHWRVIQYLKERSFTAYDLGGIDEVRWSGITRFKRGFGGGPHQFPPSSDYVFRPYAYAMYRLQHRLRHTL